MAQGLENGTLQVQSQSEMAEAREPAWKESEQDPESLGRGLQLHHSLVHPWQLPTYVEK